MQRDVEEEKQAYPEHSQYLDHCASKLRQLDALVAAIQETHTVDEARTQGQVELGIDEAMG